VVQVQGWFAGCLLLPLAARLMYAVFLHATIKKAEERGVTAESHSRAAMYFVKAVGLLEVLLLVWPVTAGVLVDLFSFDPEHLAWTLYHAHWRLFRWGLAVVASLLIFEQLSKPLRFWRFLHHGSIITVICLCGIPWLSHYDLLLFCTGMTLHLSFLAFNSFEFFAISWHFMHPRSGPHTRLLRCTAAASGAAAILGHGFVVTFYAAALPLFQAWAPFLVLVFLQVCLLCENVHNIHVVWNLGLVKQKSADDKDASQEGFTGVDATRSIGLAL